MRMRVRMRMREALSACFPFHSGGEMSLLCLLSTQKCHAKTSADDVEEVLLIRIIFQTPRTSPSTRSKGRAKLSN